tara:strand:+ start:245 stop:460 length:216 start_codon:yes stop_codon:yes gene_type:complete
MNSNQLKTNKSLEDENSYLLSLLKKVYNIRLITNLTPVEKRRLFDNQKKCSDAVNTIWNEVESTLKKYNSK